MFTTDFLNGLNGICVFKGIFFFLQLIQKKWNILKTTVKLKIDKFSLTVYWW